MANGELWIMSVVSSIKDEFTHHARSRIWKGSEC